MFISTDPEAMVIPIWVKPVGLQGISNNSLISVFLQTPYIPCLLNNGLRQSIELYIFFAFKFKVLTSQLSVPQVVKVVCSTAMKMNYTEWKWLGLMVFTMLGSMASAQTADNPKAFGINQDYNVYNVSLANREFGRFDSSISSNIRLSYGRYLSRFWEFNMGVSNGVILNQEQDSRFVSKSYSLGFDADILLKFNNGAWLRQDARIAPYLNFGYNYNYRPGFKKAGLAPATFANEYGLGSKIRIGEWSSLNLQAAVNQELSGDFDTHLQYRLGYIQTIGKRRSEPNEKRRVDDYDGDGVADADDDCPTEIGILKNGCPDDWVDPTIRLAQLDSLQLELDKQSIQLDQKDVLIDSLMNREPVVVIAETPKSNPPKTTPEVEPVKPQPTPVTPKTETKPEEDKKQPSSETPDYTPPTPGDYYIIVASTRDRKWADAYADQLGKQYPTVKVLPQPNGFYRVGIYATRDREQADKILEYAKQNGLTGWIAQEKDE